MANARIAFVTGASRGIGKVVAIWLARAGFDVAISSRSLTPGEGHEHSPTAKGSDSSPIPGSLQETAAEIERAGARAMVVAADLTSPASIAEAATRVLERWGPVEVVVNAGRHGHGEMDPLLETPLPGIEAVMRSNFIAPLLLTQIFAPGMIERGRGVFINFSSTAAFSTPTKPPGAGGWGITYGATKAAGHRLAGFVSLEFGARGLLAFNVEPGLTWTERVEQDMGAFGFNLAHAGTPDVQGAVAVWLATRPEASQYNGSTIYAQRFCAEHNLLDGWDRSRWVVSTARGDTAGAELQTAVAVAT